MNIYDYPVINPILETPFLCWHELRNKISVIMNISVFLFYGYIKNIDKYR